MNIEDFKKEHGIYSKKDRGEWVAWHTEPDEWDYLQNKTDPFGEGSTEEEAIKSICLLTAIQIPEWL